MSRQPGRAAGPGGGRRPPAAEKQLDQRKVNTSAACTPLARSAVVRCHTFLEDHLFLLLHLL
eukprot:scaffold187822_cov28-Tisochrysis_lutea.AAC.1